MALWKARALSPEQKVQIVDEENKASGLLVEEEPADKSLDAFEEESETRSLQSEESGSFLGFVDVDTPMSVVYSSVLSVPVSLSLSTLYSLSIFIILAGVVCVGLFCSLLSIHIYYISWCSVCSYLVVTCDLCCSHLGLLGTTKIRMSDLRFLKTDDT